MSRHIITALKIMNTLFCIAYIVAIPFSFKASILIIMFAIFYNIAEFVERYLECKEREWLNQPVDCEMKYEIHLTKENEDEN